MHICVRADENLMHSTRDNVSPALHMTIFEAHIASAEPKMPGVPQSSYIGGACALCWNQNQDAIGGYRNGTSIHVRHGLTQMAFLSYGLVVIPSDVRFRKPGSLETQMPLELPMYS